MNRLIVVSEKGCINIELYMYKDGNYDLKN